MVCGYFNPKFILRQTRSHALNDIIALKDFTAVSHTQFSVLTRHSPTTTDHWQNSHNLAKGTAAHYVIIF